MYTYAGIGSRETPVEILVKMSNLARYLTEQGYTLRSGGAPGADTAFEQGAGWRKQIYLPWKKFNDHDSPLWRPSDEAMDLASQHHPLWDKLPESVRKLMARNAHQILGKHLKEPVSFVVCWTPDGCEKGETRTNKTGGTGLAIAIASHFGIPVYNLKNPDALARLKVHLENQIG